MVLGHLQPSADIKVMNHQKFLSQWMVLKMILQRWYSKWEMIIRNTKVLQAHECIWSLETIRHINLVDLVWGIRRISPTDKPTRTIWALARVPVCSPAIKQEHHAQLHKGTHSSHTTVPFITGATEVYKQMKVFNILCLSEKTSHMSVLFKSGITLTELFMSPICLSFHWPLTAWRHLLLFHTIMPICEGRNLQFLI